MPNDETPSKPRLGFLVLDGEMHVEHEGRKLDEHLLGTMPRPPEGDVHLKGAAMVVEALALGLEPNATITLGPPNDQQYANGTEVVRRAAAAAKRGDKRELGEWIAAFPALVLRVPEVHEYLDALPLKRAQAVAGRRKPVGRPRNHGLHLAYVATLEALKRRRRISIAKAADLLAPKLRPRVTAETLRNIHTAHAKHARMHCEGIFYPASGLTPNEWGVSPTMTLRVLL